MTATVLLVEDEPDLVDVMSVALQRAGHDVITVGAGAAAVAATGARHIDVVVMDRGLPDMDGTEATALMRASGYRGTILIASGHAGADHATACRDAGADDVLVKPFALSDLIGRVQELTAATELHSAS